MGIIINCYNVIQEYLKVWKKCVSADLIQTAFCTTGIFPINPGVFMAEEFAPSRASSSIAHVPDSFPADVPTSDPAIPTDAEEEGSSLDSDTDCARIQPFSTAILPDDDSDEDSDYAGDYELQNGDDDEGQGADDAMDEDNDNFDSQTHDRSVESSSCNSLCFSSLVASLKMSEVIYQSCIVPIHEDEAKSHDELLKEVRALRQQVQSLCDELKMKDASMKAANAHCSIIKRVLSNTHTQLANTMKRKERGSTKVKAHFLTLPKLKEQFDEDERQYQERKRQEAEKASQRAAEAEA